MPKSKTKTQQDFSKLHNAIFLKEERASQLARENSLAQRRNRWEQAMPQLKKRLSKIKSFDVVLYDKAVQSIVFEEDPKQREQLLKEFSAKYDASILAVFPNLRKPDDTKTVILAIIGSGGECLQLADLGSCPESTVAPPYASADDGGDDFHSADPRTGKIGARVRRAGINWPHAWALVSNPVSVPGNSTQVIVRASVDIPRVGVTLAGVGFAHGWCSIELSVSDGHSVLCRDFRELENRSTWLGGYDTFFITDPGPHLDLVCCFERAAMDIGCNGHYVASVKVAVDGTYFGFSGGISEIFAEIKSFSAIGCP